VTETRTLFLAAGSLTAIASLLHLAVIVGGPPWYRFFGAGEPMAQAAARGAMFPAIVTLGIALVLAIWAVVAFSAAGILPRLPLLKWALAAIAFIFLARGLVGLTPNLWRPDLSLAFKLWSSVIVFGIGTLYAVATWRSWKQL
jgi:hypothetical protein